MRTGDKLFVARGNIIHRQIAQPAHAKIGARKRASNVSMHYGAFEVISIIRPIGKGCSGRKVAQETASEGITSSCGISDLFERIGWCAKIRAIGSEKQSAVAAQFHDDIFQTQGKELAHPGKNAG